MRYRRQMTLKGFGQEGQDVLSAARILVVGVGGLGCPAAQYLAAAGVGTLGLIDGDAVEETNLHRQILFRSADIGRNKAVAAAAVLREMNPGVVIRVFPEHLTSANCTAIVGEFDIIIDGTDNFSTKYLINDIGVKLGVPVIHGAISQFEGRVTTFLPGKGPCLRCLFPAPPASFIPNCAESGVLGAVAGQVGTLQAVEALKVVLSEHVEPLNYLKPLNGRMLVLDMALAVADSFPVFKNPSCTVCSRSPSRIIIEESAGPACSLNVFQRIPCSEFQLNSGTDFQTIDVRETEEWKRGHIPGAIHCPLSRLRQGNAQGIDPSRRALLYCVSGKRSTEAGEILRKMGHSEPALLWPGMEDWKGPVVVPSE